MQRPQNYSSPSDSPTPPGGQHPPNRTEPLRPLFTRAPLSLLVREKNPSPPPRRRKKQEPKTPLMTFNPLQSTIPSGRQDPPALTPVSYQAQPTPISTSNEYPDWTPDEVEDQQPSATTAPPHTIPPRRSRPPSGGDESPQVPTYPITYYRYADHYESPSSGESSSSLPTSYTPSPHPHYGLDSNHQGFQQDMMAHYCPTGAEAPQLRRPTPDAYGAPRDPGYQGGAWPPYPYTNGGSSF